MTNPRGRHYAATIERLYDLDPKAARVIEQYVADLRAECARRREETRTARAALARLEAP